MGFLPAPDPAACARSAEERDRAHAARSLRTGIHLSAASRAHPWQPYELDAYRRQGIVRRSAAGGDAAGGCDSGFVSVRVRPAAIRGHLGTVARTARRRRCGDHARNCTGGGVPVRVTESASRPIPEPDGIGNGTHIHWSFLDDNGRPVLYEPQQRWQLSLLGSQFIAGIQHHLPALCAVTAPPCRPIIACVPTAGRLCKPTSRRSIAARRCASAR